MKKGLKIWLISCASVRAVWLAWAWLTKAWVISNWLWIEALCPNQEEVRLHWYIIHTNTLNNVNDVDDVNVKIIYHEQNEGIRSKIPMRIVEEWEISTLAKPIIYLYPTEETEVNVTLWIPNNLSHTYPKYNSERWRNVIAQPNGDLEDIDTWRKLYALYREWKTYAENNFEEWFVVKWEDTISFLEEKLAILWLNEREAEEFIVYWLPQMENNKYNLIRFETKQEQDENMPLNITPEPDTVIRVMMDWKVIDEPVNIPEQELFTPERKWFTVVEWWGSPRN